MRLSRSQAIETMVVIPMDPPPCPRCDGEKVAICSAEVDAMVRPMETKGWTCVCDCGHEWFEENEETP